jgi:hypothetical protein
VKLSDLFGAPGVPLSKLRQEIFALGGRHLGDPLAGALDELKDPQLTAERRSLLRAVVAHLKSGKPGWTDAKGASRRLSTPASLADTAYVGVLIAAGIWVTIVVRALMA